MDNLQDLMRIQKKEGYTHYEMALFMEIPENTWKKWVYGNRTPRGPAATLIKLTLLTLQGQPVTRQQLLEKTGRTEGLNAETLKEIRNEK